MIALERIDKSYGGQSLLRDLSWRIGRGERIGLVGPNGAGKTTLCRILAGVEEADSGRVHLDSGVTVGYLPQDVATASELTVLAEALSGFDRVWRLEARLEELAVRMAGPAADPSWTEEYGEVQHQFDALGGYQLESQAKVILSGLGFRPDELHRPLNVFSGGWRMRAALARLLLLRPDLLLLDEPTNHLDLESLRWLEEFLAAYDGTVVLVSHDRYFLNRMVTAIADISEGDVTVYPGDYDHFLVEREARHALLEARQRNQAKRVAEIERFIDRFRYQATKARQVQSRIKMLEKVERIEVAPRARQIHFAFPQPPRTGRMVARLTDLHKAYGSQVVYSGVDFAVERGERVALVGVNGAGKSTLLKITAGVLPFERGERDLGAHVDVHYYAQHQLDALDTAKTVLEELEAADPQSPVGRLRTILGSFLLGGDAVDKRIAVLSGGEKARVALAKMLLKPAPLLCLDEPTNHLDLASKEVLEDALLGFTGTMVFISHDRYFINRIATRVVEVEHGQLTSYAGDYDEFLSWKAGTSAPAVPSVETPAPGAAPAAPPSPRSDRRAEKRRDLDREIKAIKARLGGVERQIHELEARLAEVGLAMADPGLYRDGRRAREIAQTRKEMEERVAWLMKEWEDLSLQLTSVSEDA